MKATTFDCGAVIAQAFPGRKRVSSGFVEDPSLHLFAVPTPGKQTPPGLHFTSMDDLRALKRAIDHALADD